MKRKFILFASALLISICSFAQDTEAMTKVMLEQANEMGKKFIAKDYAGFLKYSHPAVVKVMGGEEKMIADTTRELEALGKDGVTFLNVTFDAPEKMVKAGNEWQCTLMENIIMHVPMGKLTATTTMIAISQDEGKSWYFVDAAGNNIENMRLLLPTLSQELFIPIPQDPVFEADVKTE